MFIDALAILLLIMAAWKGYSKGLIVALFSLVAFIIGLAAAVKFSAVVAGWLGTQVTVNKQWLPTLAFTVVFIAVVFIVRLGAVAIEKAVQLVLLGWVNRLGGILFFVLLYGIIFSILLFYATQLNLLSAETIAKSNTYTYIIPLGQQAINGIGAVVPIFKDLFTQLQNFFETIKVKL